MSSDPQPQPAPATLATCKTCGGNVCPDCNPPDVADEIVEAQRHGRQKYGRGCDDLSHDNAHTEWDWFEYIKDHVRRAEIATGMDRREHLVKAAGLCKSAVEAFDRRHQWWTK